MRLARVSISHPSVPRGHYPSYWWPLERVGVERLHIPVPVWASFAAWHRLLANWPREWAA